MLSYIKRVETNYECISLSTKRQDTKYDGQRKNMSITKGKKKKEIKFHEISKVWIRLF